MSVSKQEIGFLRAILPKIETMQIRNCSRQGDIYEDLLTHCTKLKRLLVQEADLFTYKQQRVFCSWLLQTYPQLEYLELIPKVHMKIHELTAFFERNSTVRGFSTSNQSLWCNRDQLLKSTVKLDVLEVKFFTQNLQYYGYHFDNSDSEEDEPNEPEEARFEPIFKLLNQLYEKKFYQRVHLYVESVDEKTSRLLASVKGVEKLCIKKFTHIYNLSHLSGIKELAI